MEASIPNRLLIELAFDLLTDWKKLGRMLGLHKKTEQISLDYKGNVAEQGYRMLITWRQKEGAKTTFGALARGLMSASRDDLVEKYCVEGREFSAIEEIGHTKSGQVSEVDIDGIAQDLGKEWLWVGRLLGLDDSSLDQIQEANQIMYECSYQMLTLWTKKNASGATYNQLAQVLLHRVVQMSNIAETYCFEEPVSQESAGTPANILPTGDKAQQPYNTALEDASDPLSKLKALLLEESSLKRDIKTNILRGKVKEEGDFWELTEAAAFIRFPPKALTEPMEITCSLWSHRTCSPPLDENEALVSNVIELSRDGPPSLELSRDFNEGVTLALSHSATDLEGYEVVIQQLMDSENNEWKDLETKNTWRASGIQGDPPLAEAKVTQCSSFAVIWRLKSFIFSSSPTSMTDPVFTCIVSEYPDVSVAIPRSDLPASGDFSLTIKVQEVPCDEGKDDGVLVGPILHISSSPDVRSFKEPVTIKIPFTLREAKKEVLNLSSDGQLRILFFNCGAKYPEWTEITDELKTPADLKDGVVTFKVKRFSGYMPIWCWKREREPSSSDLQHLAEGPKMPQKAGFLACLRETIPSGTLMLTLFCYPLHMKDLVYSTVSSRSKVLDQVQKNGLEDMCKDDKAFISVMEKIKPLKDNHLENFFLNFLGDDYFERDMLVSVEGEGVPEVILAVRQEEQQEGKLMCELFFSDLKLLKGRQSPAGSFVTPTDLSRVRRDLHPGSEDVYKMTANPRGLVLIINNRTFDRKAKLSKRRGSEKDVESIQTLFEGLQFEVHKKLNRTGDEIIGLLRNFARMDHSQFDCFVVWLMSHGNENGIYGTDGEIVPIEAARNFFSNARCKSLKGKPKLFFIQACRGHHRDRGVEVTDGPKRRPFKTRTVPAQSNHPDETIPDQRDFMTAYATVRKYVSYRRASRGSSYVRCLVKVFREHAWYKHLLELLTLVIYQVGKIEHRSYRKLKQCPQQEPTLSKLLFFGPGL